MIARRASRIDIPLASLDWCDVRGPQCDRMLNDKENDDTDDEELDWHDLHPAERKVG